MMLRSVALAFLLAASLRVQAMISVGVLSPEEAAGLGITMKQRPNGDAGVMVWLEFKKQGVLDHFTYAEVQLHDPAGKPRLSARLEPHPVNHGQPTDLVTVAFSAQPAELDHCAFLIAAYGSSRGDVGFVLKVKDHVAGLMPRR